ncbi:CLUMA_CG010301, isoform A [Clunio marinus]|uniref:CLUMA_CG010301, isoform A n=1 Tax=Clunio marinus TaxID=568069 RepID=A0A1J1I9X3_9DIPT|nr:CLUMA_CG010301, isoform A [Clunio marinus]
MLLCDVFKTLNRREKSVVFGEMKLLKVTFSTFLLLLHIFHPAMAAGGEKARQKCLEYSKFVFVNEVSPVLSATALQSNRVSKCGIVETPLIVGGQRVNENEFPHMAAIGYPSNDFSKAYAFKCGGTVISEQFILTAAHCAYDRESGGPVVVKLGVIYIDDNRSNAQIINIASFISHPLYKSSEKYYDIALIRLKSFIRFDEHVRPACLSTRFETWHKMIAIGFGKTNYVEDFGSLNLNKVLLSNVDQNTCKRTYQTFKQLKNGIIDSQFCAGEEEGNKDTCLVVLREPYCMYNIVGITSFGKFCGFASSYGVYTNVTSFIDFIESNVWP